jgi:hypothetical protein
MDRTSVKSSDQTGATNHSSENWLQIFDDENVQFIILDAQLDFELVNVTRSHPDWNIDFEDDELVIFTLDKRN